jgi:citrate synthase
MELQEKLGALLPSWRECVKKLTKECANVKVGEVNIGQVYGGMRDIESLVTDISYVDPQTGIRFRGFTIPQVLEMLPKPEGAEMPLVGGLYYLLLIGEVPSAEQALAVEAEWKRRSQVPPYVFNMLRAMPAETHPMTLLSQAVLALQVDSQFVKRYQAGMKRDEYWIPTLEDSLNLTAKLPVIAAYIYNLKYRKGEVPVVDPNLDLGANFAKMLGVADQKYKDLSRLYYILHSDHESGNVSAHAMHLVGSALSDVYLAFSASLNGLAGPLHGLANQECLGWLLEVYKKFNGTVPTKEQLTQFANDTLTSGKVIPGYGHAVLRTPDPRFIAQYEFGKKHFPNDPLFQLAGLVYEVVPGVLKAQGKAKNPWPNVDAISGTLQYYYQVREFDFYTVLFGISRALGVTANSVWARALGQPIERPKSMTTAMLEEIAAQVTKV